MIIVHVGMSREYAIMPGGRGGVRLLIGYIPTCI
jgi:hypothetical protein